MEQEKWGMENNLKTNKMENIYNVPQESVFYL